MSVHSVDLITDSEDDTTHVQVVNETFGGYQLIYAKSDRDTFKVHENVFYPHDRYYMLYAHSTTEFHDFLPPVFINKETLEATFWTVQKGRKHDEPQKIQIVQGRGDERITEDELRDGLKNNKFKQISQNLLYDADRRIVIGTDGSHVYARKIPQGWTPFLLEKWSPFAGSTALFDITDLFLVRKDVPLGTVKVKDSSIASISLNKDSDLNTEHKESHLPVPSNVPVLTDGQHIRFEEINGGIYLPLNSSEVKSGMKYAVEGHTGVMFVNGEGKVFFNPNKDTFYDIGLQLPQVSILTTVSDAINHHINSMFINTWGVQHYRVDIAGKVHPSNQILDKIDPTGTLKAYLQPDGFHATVEAIAAKISKICS